MDKPTPAIPNPIIMNIRNTIQKLETTPDSIKISGMRYTKVRTIVLTTIVVLAYLEMLFSLKYALTRLLRVDEKSLPIVCENLKGFSSFVAELMQILFCNITNLPKKTLQRLKIKLFYKNALCTTC